jgi:nitrogen-specific signal transduction histidine kinase
MEHKKNEAKASERSFIGKILEIFSHELRNHLAIINESAGLILDLMEVKRPADRGHDDQYIKTVRCITNQVEKILALINYFDRFSQRLTRPATTVIINDLLDELIVLIQRFVRQRRIVIERDFQKKIPPLSTDATKLQFVAFCIMEREINRLAEHGSIVVKTERSNDGVVVSIIPKGDKRIPPEDKDFCPPELIENVIGDLGGEVYHEEEKAKIRFPLEMPSPHD